MIEFLISNGNLQKRLTVKVRGRVQGVFFRHAAQIRAGELGLTGWARNEDDGSVTIMAEGNEAKLNEFLDWCRHGPPLARVEDSRTTWQEATGEFTQFEIL